jgi:Fe-Mn family superoxide dismutase
MQIRQAIDLIEDKSSSPLVLEKLPYSREGLAPVMTLATVNYHYGKLAKGYVDRYNAGEGDAAFNEAGAFLHNIFFPQLQPPKSGNKPHGTSLALINRRWTSFDRFQDEFKKEAMKLQG